MSYEQAQEALRKYLKETGKSQSKGAAALGISSGAISQFLAGTYPTPDAIIKKVESLVALHEEKIQAPKEPPYVETSVSRQVIQTITYCQLQGKIGVVYGDAGIGKTEAMKAYVRSHPESIAITINPVYSSMSGVNDLLAEQLGVRERTSRRIYADIVGRLKESGRVMIVDEAQHLTKKTLDYIRCISDESRIGVCFIGNEEVYSRLKGSGKSEFAQLFSRIGMRRPLYTSNLQKADIEKVFAGAELDAGTIDFLHAISRTKYGLRGAVNVFVNTAAAFGYVNGAGIVRMAKEMNIGKVQGA